MCKVMSYSGYISKDVSAATDSLVYVNFGFKFFVHVVAQIPDMLNNFHQGITNMDLFGLHFGEILSCTKHNDFCLIIIQF